LNKTLIFVIVLILIVVYGCASPEDTAYKKGINRLNEIEGNFGVNVKTVPESRERLIDLHAQILGFSAADDGTSKALKELLEYRVKILDAERLHAEGWQWGRGSTTDWGFGCRKGSARVLNSSKIRNRVTRPRRH